MASCLLYLVRKFLKLLLMRFFLNLLLVCMVSSGFAQKQGDAYLQKAHRILKKTPVIDTHIDFPYSLVENKEWYTPDYTALALKHPVGDFDFERARAGGLYGAFMSIYIPVSYQKIPGGAKALADSLINMVDAIARDYPGKFALAPKADDIV